MVKRIQYTQSAHTRLNGEREQGVLATTGTLHYLLPGPLGLSHLEAQSLNLLCLTLGLLLLVTQLSSQALLC